jgi:predicted acyl esterase
MARRPSPPRRPTDLVTAAMSRSLRLGSRRYAITIDRAVPVPMRDGTILLADHYAPVTAEPRPAVLMRCPYGRGPQFAVSGWPLAEHGCHVLLPGDDLWRELPDWPPADTSVQTWYLRAGRSLADGPADDRTEAGGAAA